MKNLSRLILITLITAACESCNAPKDANIMDTDDPLTDSDSIPSEADKLTGNENPSEMSWVKMNSGSFVYGSPEHYYCRGPNVETEVPVTLTRSFKIAATEITQAQWTSLDFPNPSKNIGDDKPVAFVNFYETLVWCNKLSKLEGLEPCYDLISCTNEVGTGCNPNVAGDCSDIDRVFNCTGEIHRFDDWYACPGYRLPTAAEWEYAAKAGVTETRTYGGDLIGTTIYDCVEEPALNDIAWYCYNSGDKFHNVAQKLPNPWGLYDTLGNVMEWIDYFDHGQPMDYQETGQPVTDPIGERTGDFLGLRGMGFYDIGCMVNPTFPFYASPVDLYSNTGFRPVRTIFE